MEAVTLVSTSTLVYHLLSESKIATISSLNAHLQTILEKKQELTTRLQQPVVGDNLRVEAAYHDHIRELFPMVALHLAKLNQNLENIQWSHDFKQTDEQLVRNNLYILTYNSMSPALVMFSCSSNLARQ